jgi:hypothetical protein
VVAFHRPRAPAQPAAPPYTAFPPIGPPPETPSFFPTAPSALPPPATLPPDPPRTAPNRPCESARLPSSTKEPQSPASHGLTAEPLARSP